MGYTLDEIPNDITRKTPACFEPTIDYVVVKIPKWQFEKFPGADDTLGPQMKSVGEVMAMGRTFKEALMKAWRALETGKKTGAEILEPRRLTQMLVTPRPERLGYIRYAFERGMSVREVARLTRYGPMVPAPVARGDAGADGHCADNSGRNKYGAPAPAQAARPER